MENPTKLLYDALSKAYSFFNSNLFSDSLPECLITLQRKGKAYGFFSGDRFSSTENSKKVDEISLNPLYFSLRSEKEILSTLVHEMVHLEQHHFGTAPKKAYHNKQWADMMESVGLIPSTTGYLGGKRTGAKVSHYIEAAGRFDLACQNLLDSGFILPYTDSLFEKLEKAARPTKYVCPECPQKVSGKKEMNILCGICNKQMEPE